MKEFFRGWRRKSGLLLLAMAVGTFIMWIRSHATADQIQFRSGPQHVLVIGTEPHGVILLTMRDIDHVLTIPKFFESKKQDLALTLLIQELSVRWNCDVLGFRFGQFSGSEVNPENGTEPQSIGTGHGGASRGGAAGGRSQVAGEELSMPVSDPVVATRVVVIPYWPVILGITLISAYLILRDSKFRRSDGSPRTQSFERAGAAP